MSFECRLGCGACCIAPSITTPIPGMPQRKPAGVRCVQLDANNLCKLFGRPDRPGFCNTLKPGLDMCGNNNEEALNHLAQLELLTRP